MKIIEREGKTTSKIIESFMKEFNVTLDDFKFEVIEKGSSSFLNLFGSKAARIKFTLSDSNQHLADFTKELLNKMGFTYGELAFNTSDKIYNIEIKKAAEVGHIIGKDAKLLDSIQYLLNQIVNKTPNSDYRVHLDVDGYRNRRKEALLKKIESITTKVKKREKSITLEPMHSANRRIVHQFVEKHPELKTLTVGKGEFKRVVILPANQSNPDTGIKKGTHRPRRHKRTVKS
jgi:spoIIIJ-associated protein